MIQAPAAKHELDFRRWLSAAVAATLVHILVATAAFHHFREDDIDDDVSGSAMAIDLAQLMPASDDIAPRIAPAAPQVAAQEAVSEVKPSEMMRQERIEAAPEVSQNDAAEALLPKPESEPDKREKPEEPPRDAVSASIAQEAAALPSIAAPPNTAAAAPSAGISPSARKSKTSWQKTLLAHLDKFKRYPEGARANHTEGEVLVELTMDRTGVVRASGVARSSGSSALDAEALAMVTRAEPLPQPPSDVAGEVFRMAIPVRFRLR